jgi:hypothetical protein
MTGQAVAVGSPADRILKMCERADWYRLQVENELKTISLNGSDRNLLVKGYIKIILDAHRAIVKLTRLGPDYFIPASQLCRPLYEAVLDAFWVTKFGTDKLRADLLTRTNVELPGSEAQRTEQLDKAFCAPDAGSLFNDMHKRGWKAMCDLTHSGALAINRALTDFSPDALHDHLRTMTTLVLMTADAMYRLVFNVQNKRFMELYTMYFAEKWMESNYGTTEFRNSHR